VYPTPLSLVIYLIFFFDLVARRRLSNDDGDSNTGLAGDRFESGSFDVMFAVNSALVFVMGL
jgi:hypothetical protein